MTAQEVGQWIADNVLDSEAWDKSTKKELAVKQAERNLSRWYPEAELTVDVVSYQAIWELQGIDPALKYQRHNVRSVSDNGESVHYKDGERPVVAPDVREILGPTADEIADQASQQQFGGALV